MWLAHATMGSMFLQALTRFQLEFGVVEVARVLSPEAPAPAPPADLAPPADPTPAPAPPADPAPAPAQTLAPALADPVPSSASALRDLPPPRRRLTYKESQSLIAPAIKKVAASMPKLADHPKYKAIRAAVLRGMDLLDIQLEFAVSDRHPVSLQALAKLREILLPDFIGSAHTRQALVRVRRDRLSKLAERHLEIGLERTAQAMEAASAGAASADNGDLVVAASAAHQGYVKLLLNWTGREVQEETKLQIEQIHSQERRLLDQSRTERTVMRSSQAVAAGAAGGLMTAGLAGLFNNRQLNIGPGAGASQSQDLDLNLSSNDQPPPTAQLNVASEDCIAVPRLPAGVLGG